MTYTEITTPDGIHHAMKSHFVKVMNSLDESSHTLWTRNMISRLMESKVKTISQLASGLLRESLTDEKRHSTGLIEPDLFIVISTFPCSMEEARKKFYFNGYSTYLNSMLTRSRQENENCHFLHFQFFCDKIDLWIQFTSFPNKNAMTATPFYLMPVELLDENEKRIMGIT